MSSVLTPTYDYHRNSIGTPHTPLSDKALDTLPISRPDWNAFKVLPGVSTNASSNNGHENYDQPPSSALSQYPVSNISLSPFPQFDLSPAPSIFSSPRHSAISHCKKRALSVSPLSADGINLNDIIRVSPTSLAAYMNGSSRASSANKCRFSPFTNGPQPLGNQGHLNPRAVAQQQHSHQQTQEEAKVKEEFPTAMHEQMVALEQQGHHDHGQMMTSNQVIMPQEHAHMVDSYMMYRQHQHQHQIVQPQHVSAPITHQDMHQQYQHPIHIHPNQELTSQGIHMKHEPMVAHHHQQVPHHEQHMYHQPQPPMAHQNHPFYHPEQHMPQLTVRPPPLPRPAVSEIILIM